MLLVEAEINFRNWESLESAVRFHDCRSH